MANPLFQNDPLAQAQALNEAQIAIARIETQIEYMTKTIADLNASNTLLMQQVQGISRTLSEATGGWRMLMAIGGSAAAIGGAVTWALSHIAWK